MTLADELPFSCGPTSANPYPSFAADAYSDPESFARVAVPALFEGNHHIVLNAPGRVPSRVPTELYEKAYTLLNAATNAWFCVWTRKCFLEPCFTRPDSVHDHVTLRSWCQFQQVLLKYWYLAEQRYNCHLGQQRLEAEDVIRQALPLLGSSLPDELAQWHRTLADFRIEQRPPSESDTGWLPDYRRAVQWAWGLMRQTPGKLRPPSPEEVNNPDAAIRALDLVVFWCDGSGEAPEGDDPSAYRPAKEFLNSDIPTYKALRRVLKKRAEIRTKKPTKQRLLIHAGDWSRYQNALALAAFNALDANPEIVDSFLAESQRTKEKIQRSKVRM
jgi:hypothetical protein